MEQEEAMLAATLETLRHVRAALIAGDLATLNRALDQQGHTARAASELQVRRKRLRSDLANSLGQPPESVTLQALAKSLPGEPGERLAGCRVRLKKMAEQVDRLNRGNAALVQQSLGFLHRLFVGLTGGQPSSQSYGPGGVRQDTPCGSIIEGRG